MLVLFNLNICNGVLCVAQWFDEVDAKDLARMVVQRQFKLDVTVKSNPQDSIGYNVAAVYSLQIFLVGIETFFFT